MRAAAQGGERAVHARKGTGRPSVLTPKQTEQVRRWINGKAPRQDGFGVGLWTSQVVRDLIAHRVHRQVGVTTVGRLLAQLGPTPQKPLRRADARDPVAIARWEREEYPALRRRAKRRGARSSSWTKRVSAPTPPWGAPGPPGGNRRSSGLAAGASR